MAPIIVPGLIKNRRWQSRAEDLLAQGMRSDTVADIVSDEFEISRSEVLDYIDSLWD